ncbi:MAG: hypothetical protein K8F57_00900, partial [Alphaproteobacteria bacterium]|nr:hypothetical protein [Alphaproteobacteria bacterium]
MSVIDAAAGKNAAGNGKAKTAPKPSRERLFAAINRADRYLNIVALGLVDLVQGHSFRPDLRRPGNRAQRG